MTRIQLCVSGREKTFYTHKERGLSSTWMDGEEEPEKPSWGRQHLNWGLKSEIFAKCEWGALGLYCLSFITLLISQLEIHPFHSPCPVHRGLGVSLGQGLGVRASSWALYLIPRTQLLLNLDFSSLLTSRSLFTSIPLQFKILILNCLCVPTMWFLLIGPGLTQPSKQRQ